MLTMTERNYIRRKVDGFRRLLELFEKKDFDFDFRQAHDIMFDVEQFAIAYDKLPPDIRRYYVGQMHHLDLFIRFTMYNNKHKPNGKISYETYVNRNPYPPV